MITKDWKVAKVLDAYPATFDVFLEISPHFSKLKNKVLRKTIARRVTLEQAARVGGVNVNTLLMKLNDKAGFKVDTASMNNFESHDSVWGVHGLPLPDKSEITLDVRPIIESGTDPFKTIMKAVKDMKHNEMLHLINSFEPVPLYSVMDAKGFTYKAEKRGNKWHIWFWSRDEDNKHTAADKPTTLTYKKKSAENIKEIDVRGFEPPQPMVTILETLNQIEDNTILLVHHHREPVLLYDKLEELGYKADVEKKDENYYIIIIRKI